ncbi:MAG: DUF3024 domain-containing protein [Actinomycetota bacterium]
MAITQLDRRRISSWCEARVPAAARDEIVVSAIFRGNSAEIIEGRPPWREDFGPERSSNRIAKLTVDPVANTWILFATDRNDRLLNYSRDIGVGTSLVEILAELDADPTSIFWG